MRRCVGIYPNMARSLSTGEVQTFLKLNSRPQHPLSGRDVTLVTEREGWGRIPNHIPYEGGYRYVILPRGLIPSPAFVVFAQLKHNCSLSH